MELNLLALPLLGGYVFYTQFNGTRYYAKRCSSQRLIFNSAVAGLLLLFVARGVVVVFDDQTPTTAHHLTLALSATMVSGAMVLGSLLLLARPTSWKFAPIKVGDLWRPALGVVVGLEVVWILTRLWPPWPFAVPRPNGWLFLIAVGGELAFVFLVGALAFRAQIEFRATLFRACMQLFLLSLVVLSTLTYAGSFNSGWATFSPYADSGTAFFAGALGLTLHWPLNLLYPYQSAIRDLHRNKRTEVLDRLLFQAMTSYALVQLSMNDDKVYVGWVLELPIDPDPAGHIALFPLVSGFRHPETKRIEYTTFYDEVYRKISDAFSDQDKSQESAEEYGGAGEPGTGEDKDDRLDNLDKLEAEFSRVLPLAAIRTAGLFNVLAHRHFRKGLDDHSTEPAEKTAGGEPTVDAPTDAGLVASPAESSESVK